MATEELKALSARMFAANPELNALRTARMAERHRGGRREDRQRHRIGAIRSRAAVAAVATAAIVIELADIPPGPQREQATAVAMRFLEAGRGDSRPGKRQSAGR